MQKWEKTQISGEIRKSLKKEMMNEFMLEGLGRRVKDRMFWVKRRRQGGVGNVWERMSN